MLSSSYDFDWNAVTADLKATASILKLGSPESFVHGVLLFGAPGSGKSHQARNLIAHWLCKASNAAGACGECQACAAFGRDRAVDLLTIEPGGPSRLIKIEQIAIRSDAAKKQEDVSLEEFFRTSSLSARNKVVWVKDADRMNPHAANAFLKTLEEPPINTKIVMTTSNLGELLPTILSRCVAIRCDIPDDVPEFDLPPHLLQYAGPTIGMRLEVASRRDLYEAWFQLANSIAKSTYANSLKLAEDAKALVDKAPVDGARNQNAWSLEALAGMLTVLQVPSIVLDRVVEAHRYVLGNVNAQLVWDVLLVNSTRERIRARLS